jgi:hypothetical protein
MVLGGDDGVPMRGDRVECEIDERRHAACQRTTAVVSVRRC